ncbi:tunicamycin resistance protein [Bacillus sp. AFS015802]|uniref:AAA family ATPase n=1 Tax=Bacillus sp. AFS015802 TaxID=2033486 RepID=UPI000BF532C9|nr:AAA family ATPase [Bacillus sp. AFS015802]PFA67146.1 tunicamycin resistance protein [Bacillus sp. AFS015802]
MIIWINGAFGSGKTQTAYELHRRLPGSYVYDPEEVGYLLRKMIPDEASKEDFQDYPSWRDCNYSILKYIDKQYKGVIIVPMTVVNAQYFSEMVEQLRNDDLNVNHVVLWAAKPTIERRLRSRGERKNSWGAQQIDRCMSGLSHEIFENRILTDHLTIEKVAETIADMFEIKLMPDDRSRVRKKWSRLKIQIKQLRMFA